LTQVMPVTFVDVLGSDVRAISLILKLSAYLVSINNGGDAY
jgi:hypothetical protein